VSTLMFFYVDPNSPSLSPQPKAYDLHVYSDPQYFSECALPTSSDSVDNESPFIRCYPPAGDSFKFDSYPRDGTIYFELEYAVTASNGGCLYGDVSCGRLPFPTIQGRSIIVFSFIHVDQF